MARMAKRKPYRPALVIRHDYPTVRERLDSIEVRQDFIEAQLKATLKRYDELAKLVDEKLHPPEPLDDDITRLAFGPKAGAK